MEQRSNELGRQNANIGQSTQGTGNSGFSYIARKTEKLTTALYMVTDILSDKEPIKWRARETAVEILSDITVANTTNPSERMTMLREVMRKIEKIASLLDVAETSRLMSEMNASVLKKEYLALRDTVRNEWDMIGEMSKREFTATLTSVSEAPLLRSGLERASTPAIEEKRPTPTPVKEMRREEVSRPIVDQRPGREDKVVIERAPLPEKTSPVLPSQKIMVSDTRVEKNVPGVVHRPFANAFQAALATAGGASATRRDDARGRDGSTPTLRSNDSMPLNRESQQYASRQESSASHSDRRKIILALLKQKPSLSVSDVAKSISGVSEKTIQRELLGMVSEGILKKQGERRWSTYSLRS
jgi:hypothetical protein